MTTTNGSTGIRSHTDLYEVSEFIAPAEESGGEESGAEAAQSH
ncbi:hypothetical protein [Actinomyces bouchesdurhonensis]|nr:hypothetical protein [Actinomyces bouchesdurhonensis]